MCFTKGFDYKAFTEHSWNRKKKTEKHTFTQFLYLHTDGLGPRDKCMAHLRFQGIKRYDHLQTGNLGRHFEERWYVILGREKDGERSVVDAVGQVRPLEYLCCRTTYMKSKKASTNQNGFIK